MNAKLKEILTHLNAGLINDTIEFYIGKTDDIRRRFLEKYEPEGCDCIKEIACGDANAINQAEIDLIEYYMSHEFLSERLSNENEGGGGNPEADKLYVVVKYKETDDFRDKFLDFLPHLKSITLP